MRDEDENGTKLAAGGSPMSGAEARALTAEVRRDAAALWSKLLRLYDGRAWEAMDYPSWPAYCQEQFGAGRAHAYRLLRAAKVNEEISLHVETRGATEAQMRALGAMRPETRDRVLALVRRKYDGLAGVSVSRLRELAWEASGLRDAPTVQPDPAQRRVRDRLNRIARELGALEKEPTVVQDVLRTLEPEQASAALRGIERIQHQIDFVRDVLAEVRPGSTTVMAEPVQHGSS